ncbi:MAG: hypothetical protein WDM92_00445 [Caulobacteraceae bacterium]
MSFADSLNRSRYDDEAVHIQRAYDIIDPVVAAGRVPVGWTDLVQQILIRAAPTTA